MMARLRALWCRLFGHDWQDSGLLDFDGNHLWLCKRCEAGEWRSQ